MSLDLRKILMSGGRKFEIVRAQGLIGGIRLNIDGVILGYRSAPGAQEEVDNSSIYRRFIKQFLQEIDNWQLDTMRRLSLSSIWMQTR
jgi:hypothetical protein